MNDARYKFPIYLYKNCVYVAGGKTSMLDVNSLNACERFNLTSKKWEKLGNLNEEKYNSSLVEF